MYACDLNITHWTRKLLHAAINPLDYSHEVNDPVVQGALQDLEAEGLIKLVRQNYPTFKSCRDLKKSFKIQNGANPIDSAALS